MTPAAPSAQPPQSPQSPPASRPQPQLQPPPQLHLRIGTLSLPGASPAQAARIGDAMRLELAALLAASGGSGLQVWPQQASRQHARIDAGTLPLAAGDRPEAIGRRLARAVALGLLQADAGSAQDAP